jgi:hypothetical protein
MGVEPGTKLENISGPVLREPTEIARNGAMPNRRGPVPSTVRPLSWRVPLQKPYTISVFNDSH